MGTDLDEVLRGYGRFLVERGLVREEKVRYYVGWVRRYLLSPVAAGGVSRNDRIQAFVDALVRQGCYEEWQLNQADAAVRLFLVNYPRGGGDGLGFRRRAVSDESESGPPEGGTTNRGAVAVLANPGAGAAERSDSRPLAEASLPLPPEGGTQTGKLDGAGLGATAADARVGTAVKDMRQLLRLRHYSYHTETTYLGWVVRYFEYCGKRGLDATQPAGIKDFLSHLALQGKVSASTQNQAFNALLFLFREVWTEPLGEMSDTLRAKRGPKLPVVLSVDEVRELFRHVTGVPGLMLRLTYGGGLRVSEVTRLRVKDIDFAERLLYVRAGKGDKDRTSLLPDVVAPDLKAHLGQVWALHKDDLAAGRGAVYLPDALARKYPNAAKEWCWQYVFPARGLSVDPRSGTVRRHHLTDKAVQDAMQQAVRAAGIHKPASVHTLRHSFATHLLLQNVNVRQVQDYLGHEKLETTMVYTHVVRGMSPPATSPLDALNALGACPGTAAE